MKDKCIKDLIMLIESSDDLSAVFPNYIIKNDYTMETKERQFSREVSKYVSDNDSIDLYRYLKEGTLRVDSSTSGIGTTMVYGDSGEIAECKIPGRVVTNEVYSDGCTSYKLQTISYGALSNATDEFYMFKFNHSMQENHEVNYIYFNKLELNSNPDIIERKKILKYDNYNKVVVCYDILSAAYSTSLLLDFRILDRVEYRSKDDSIRITITPLATTIIIHKDEDDRFIRANLTSPTVDGFDSNNINISSGVIYDFNCDSLTTYGYYQDEEGEYLWI